MTSLASRRTPAVLAVLGVALLAVCLPFALLGELPGERWLAALGDDRAAYAAAGIALLAADTVLPVPSSVVGALLGAQLGFGAGFACAFAGLALGNLLGWSLGRLWPARRSAAVPTAPSLLLLAASRPVPVLAEAVMLASGALRVPFVPALAASCAGSAVYALALAASGAAWLADGWLNPGLAVPLLLPALAWWIWRWRRARA